MRRLITFTSLVFSLLASSAFAGEAPAEKTAEESEDETAEAGLQESSELPDLLAAPGEHDYELAITIGSQSWETTYGARDPNLTLGLSFSYLFTPWLRPVFIFDYSSRSESPGDLEFSNSQTFLGPGVGVGTWLGVFRLDLELHSGILLRTSSYDDSFGTAGDDVRLALAGDVLGGVGVGLFGAASLSFEGGVRLFSDRMNILFLFELAWCFGGG